MRSVRSRPPPRDAPGSSKPAGGWKWMPFGASSWTARPFPENAVGATPYARLKERENAASDP